MEFYVDNTYINISTGNIHIHDSYKIKKTADKKHILDAIFNMCPDYPRSYKSALREWRAHNVMYKLHLFRKSSMHTDIEAKPKLILRICYFLISLLGFIE